MPLTVKEKIAKKLNASSDKAFVRDEFVKMGSYRQVTRALAELVKEGRLMKAGQGIWVKSKKIESPLIGEEGLWVTIPTADIVSIALEALPKLSYIVDRSDLSKDRLEGRSTQIPMKPKIKVISGRTKRKIEINGLKIQYEKNSGS